MHALFGFAHAHCHITAQRVEKAAGCGSAEPRVSGDRAPSSTSA
jgi:hypothetical protein